MSTERKLVYRLDEGMATGGVPEELHFVQRDGLSGGCPWSQDVLFFRCPQGLSALEFTSYRSFGNREVNSDAGHSRQSFNSASARGPETPVANRQVHQGSDTPGPSCGTEINHHGVGASQPVLEREVQRGDDPVLYRPARPGTSQGTDEVRRQHDYPTTGMLRDGRINEAVASGHVTFDRRGRRVPASVLDRQGGLQVPENRGPETPYERSPKVGTGDGSRESSL